MNLLKILPKPVLTLEKLNYINIISLFPIATPL